MDKISPCLWFDGNAEEAANFYVSIFKDSKINRILRWNEDHEISGGKAGDVLLVEFTLFGKTYQGLNGGPQFKFSEAVSFSVDCDDQAEVDTYWEKLTADGGKPVQCSWLTDKFGLSWQIVPRRLPELLNDPDPAKATRVMRAMQQMVKIDVAELERAAKG
ncbi:MAG: VOC family protein [Hyphomicrobiales bacterium]|jgi:predicted 3-demethylubiquinone-9 3-methyltransferase (glyoxalase superfamily)|nr:MAG: VOC family protein [Hyphomicrobiales bacterium]